MPFSNPEASAALILSTSSEFTSTPSVWKPASANTVAKPNPSLPRPTMDTVGFFDFLLLERGRLQFDLPSQGGAGNSETAKINRKCSSSSRHEWSQLLCHPCCAHRSYAACQSAHESKS